VRVPIPIITELAYDGRWRAVTADVYDRDTTSGSRGGDGESGPGQPSTRTLTINNRGGQYSPRNPLSEAWGVLGPHTPLRQSVRRLVDAFDRTVASGGWGDAAPGLPWTSHGAGGSVLTTHFFVAPGTASHVVPVANAYRQTRLADLSLMDCELRVTVTPSVTDVTGAPIEPANMLFRSTAAGVYLMARVAINANQTVSISLHSTATGQLVAPVVVPDLTYSGQPLAVAAGVEGQIIRLSVWDATQEEPVNWQVSTVDRSLMAAGGVGVRSGVASGNTNGAVTFAYSDFEIRLPRAVVEVENWPQRWDLSDADVFVPIKAAGVLQRLERARPLDSALRREVLRTAPWAYWPMEDSERSTSAVSPIPGVRPAAPLGVSTHQAPVTGLPIPAGGAPEFGRGTGIPGSAPLVDLTRGGILSAKPPVSTATSWRLEFVANFRRGSSDDTFAVPLLNVLTNGTFPWWELEVDTSATEGVGITFACYADPLGGLSGRLAAPDQLIYDGEPHLFRIDLAQSGGNITGALSMDGVVIDSTLTDIGTGLALAGTLGRITEVRVNRLEAPWEALPTSFGHVALWAPVPAGSQTAAAAHGWAGETSRERVERLAAEESARCVMLLPGGDALMGPQRSGLTLVELLREAATVERGWLVEQRGDRALAVVTAASLYNQAPALTLDYAAGQVQEGWQPDEDTAALANDVEVSRPDGGTARAVQLTGANNVNDPGADPQGVGVHAGPAVVLNVAHDTQLGPYAQWARHLGTWPGPRYPRLVLDALAAPELVDAISSVDLGRVVTVVNPPAWLGPASAAGIVTGASERLGLDVWELDVSLVPAGPWVVGQDGVAATMRAAADGSALHADVASGDTVWSVRVGGTKWTTDPAMLAPDPLHVEVGGEVAQVTAITDPRGLVAVGTAAHANNASVTPGLPAGTLGGQLMLMVAAIRNSGTGTVDTPAGWTSLSGGGTNHGLFGRLAGGTPGQPTTDGAPTVAFTGGVAGATCSAQLATFAGVRLSVEQAVAQLNGSAQDVATPRLPQYAEDWHLVVLAGWKADDSTSIATPAGFTLLGSLSSTLGDDQSLWWGYRLDGRRSPVPAGTLVITGGGSAISRAHLVALRGLQEFTVVRSANGIVKAHAAGAEVQVHEPMRAAL
jgi:hypothetical protein